MFLTDGRHDSVRDGSSPLWLSLVDKLCNVSPALVLAGDSELSCAKRSNKRGAGGLEIMHDVGRGR